MARRTAQIHSSSAVEAFSTPPCTWAGLSPKATAGEPTRRLPRIASRSSGPRIVEYNDCDEGRFVKAARRYDSVCSSGERVLLHAILYVTDFAWLADELDEGRTWRRMDNSSGEHRQAIVACIAAAI